MYHVCHDMRAGVQAVYVSDGPGRPSTKRGKVRLRPNPAAKPPPPPTTPEEQYRLEDNLDHVTALAKEVLDHLNIPRHDAPGEAEAECVELEKAKLVDAIVTTDGDTLAFGGQRILRYHSRNMKDGMQMIKADELKKARRDRGTWILLALLSGGDYSDGVPGCKDVYATKILDLAATPGSPVNILCSMLRSNTSIEGHRGMLNGWRTKFLPNFRTSVQAISANVARNIPPDFPNDMIVNLYLHPTVSPSTTIERLALRPLWQRIASAQQLRDFAARAFDWQGQSRAKQFLHALTPGLLAQHLLVSGCRQTDCSNLLHSNKPPKRVTGKASEDVPMARVRYDALKVAAIDYDEDQDLPHVRKWRHGEGDRHDPAMAYETMLPEFLLAFGAPSSAIPGEHQPGNVRCPLPRSGLPDSHQRRSSPSRLSILPPALWQTTCRLRLLLYDLLAFTGLSQSRPLLSPLSVKAKDEPWKRWPILLPSCTARK